MRCKAAVVVVLALALAGCGSSASHSSTKAAGAGTPSAAASTTSSAAAFRAHAGLAFGTFYRFIYTPYRAGEFRAIVSNRAALARAGAAASFVARQLEQALAAARTSGSLAKLVVPMQVLDEGFHAALAKLKAGRFKMNEIAAANIAIAAIKGSATSAGAPISETTPGAI